jgi:hypothetical protein
MNNASKEHGSAGKEKKELNMPNMSALKGLLSIIFGIIGIVLAYKIIISVMLFIAGFILLYYGIGLLKLTAVTKGIDDIIQKIRNAMSL